MTSSDKTSELRSGMLGDGTEEQNLSQQGNPKARVTKDDVEAAFGKTTNQPASGTDGGVTDQVSDDMTTAKETPEDTIPKDNSHNFT